MRAFLLALAVSAFSLRANAAPPEPIEPPKLVVVVVIDQFPAYIIPQMQQHFAPRGFRLLMEQGAWFDQAYYPQAATLTGVGHAMIATGGLPASTGIPGNDWYDRKADREVYCVEDKSHQWVGGKGKSEDGTSPRNLTSTTFGDEWRLVRNLAPRVIGISMKDRGSILLAGQLGKAFWYDNSHGSFVSSSYYYPERKLPGWLVDFNNAKHADKYFQHKWQRLLPENAYTGVADDRPYEIDVKGLGRTFPHLLGLGIERPGPEFYRLLATTPQGNQLTLDLARAALRGEELGRRDTTDILLVSLTSNDYCGHTFGPESIEYQDITIHTDRQLEAFFADLDKHVGLDHTMIVLTSDHGASPTVEWAAEQGLAVGRIDPEHIARDVEAALDKAFGNESWTARFLNPGLFLRSEPIERRGVSASEVEQVAAAAVRRIPGVAAVFTRHELAQGKPATTEIGRAVAATFHPERSPDLIIVQQPYWYLYKELKKNAGMHGSPYAYDTHVPVFFFGPGIHAGRHSERISITDVAPTISAYLGAPAPSASSGRPVIR